MNVLRTDTVFDTFLPVNSAIVGVTFIVNVNDTAIVSIHFQCFEYFCFNFFLILP